MKYNKKTIRSAWACLLAAGMLLTACACAKEDPFAALQLEETWERCVATNAPLPPAAAFFSAELQTTLAERGITATYATPLSTSALGEQTAHILLTAPDGTLRTVDVPYCGIYDKTPPVPEGLGDRSALCMEGVALRAGVRGVDNCVGEVHMTVDSSALDTSREGVYEVVYTLTDAAGNTASYSANVYIYRADVTEEMLMAEIDASLADFLREDMSREEMCRAIYDEVRSSLSYIADVDKSDWVRAAYTALFQTGKGDCFAYFSAAKAYLERLGIPYIEIQRTKGYTEDTHYWLLVNIAEEGEADRWYYFDTTELRSDGYNHSGCLLTAAQIQAYDRVRPNFYRHDFSSLPEVCDVIITPTPELDDQGAAS